MNWKLFPEHFPVISFITWTIVIVSKIKNDFGAFEDSFDFIDVKVVTVEENYKRELACCYVNLTHHRKGLGTDRKQ